MRLILIGPPGVGKGTQAALLTQRMGIIQVSSGVIFRAEIEAQTDLGRLAKSYIDRGELVPNGVTIEMIGKRLRMDDIRKAGFALDGFPRTVRQAAALDDILAEMSIALDKVVSLEVSEDILVSRLSGRIGCPSCGEIYHSINHPPKRDGICDKCNHPLIIRSDDQPDTIRERLKVFWENTAPVIDYYAEKGNLQRIDASRESEDVYADIVGIPVK